MKNIEISLKNTKQIYRLKSSMLSNNNDKNKKLNFILLIFSNYSALQNCLLWGMNC